MKNRIIQSLLCLLLLSLTLHAQQTESDLRQIYMQAEEEYAIGRFDASIRLLDGHMSSFSGALRTSAYRLLSLCHLAQDNAAEAERYVTLLLKEDPYYNVTIHDPLRFADMVNRLKRGEEATITTASQQAETIEEAPVPVTLITEEMIRAIGARDLRDVLAAYVLGMSIVEGDEYNISMHGVYNQTQDKILVMLNGHRLNSRGNNTEAPDFRNSLDKVKQIEVLRGPASSLYGNAALTAVVNIITKSGSDVDGLKVTYGMGTNATLRGNLLFGKRFFDSDVLVWASVYASQGERRIVKANDKDFLGYFPIDGYMYIDGFNHKPAYDLGFTLRWNKMELMMTHQYSKKVSPYSSSGDASVYSYDSYRRYNGMKPGHGRLNTRGELSYKDRKGDWSWSMNLFVDLEENSNYDVTADSLPPGPFWPSLEGSALDGEYLTDSLWQTRGVYQILEWKDYSYGGSLTGNYKYKAGKVGEGNILAGLQAEYYRMYDNTFLLGDRYGRVDITYSEQNKPIRFDSEWNVSGFVQMKQQLGTQFIFNGGLRLDYKHRFNDKDMVALSPRLALIWKANDIWNLKLGYSRSFVDAPFFYRANRTNRYAGSEDLNPEYMNSVQLSAIASFKEIGLKYDFNLYYNHFNDLIYNGEKSYSNAGRLSLGGIENALTYTGRRVKALWNVSCMYVFDYENYMAQGHRIANVPPVSSSLVVEGKVLEGKSGQSLWLKANAAVQSKQLAPLKNLFRGNFEPVNDPDNELPARCVVNVGATYHWKQWQVGAHCYNLFDVNYLHGGLCQSSVVPQQGRSFMAELSYTFK